jgi:NAD(P)-dependent dehydrogenase (short-subunit alcohol dehydrogenase family)
MDKVALVTGANRGLGLAVARGLAERGWRVLAAVRVSDRMPLIPGVEALRLDLADQKAFPALVQEIRSQVSRLNLLVNNAGMLEDDAIALLDLDPELLRRTLEVNAIGPLRLAQALAPLMGPGGRIVNVSSGGGQLSGMGTWAPAYCISKTALNAVTVQLAKALEGRGIAVNAVCPGWVRTDMGGPSAPRSVEEGAAGILWMALDAPQKLTGGFFRDGERIPW